MPKNEPTGSTLSESHKKTPLLRNGVENAVFYILLCRNFFLCNCFFDFFGFIRKFGVGSTFKIGIQTAIVLDRAQSLGANFQFENLTQNIAQQRNDLQVGQKTAAVVVVSVADIVTAHSADTRNITFFSHCFNPFL